MKLVREIYMLKKSIFLLVALLVIGTAVAPQVQAQDMKKLEALQQELELLEAKVDRGQQLTPQEAQRMLQIQQEILQAMGPYGNMFSQEQLNQMNNQTYQQQQQALERAQQQQQPQQQQPRQQVQSQQGQNAGWPPASAFQGRFKISPLRQPAGTTARYDTLVDSGVVNTLNIYITSGNANGTLQDLKQQIEAITGRQMSQSGNDYHGFIPDPNNRNGNIRFWLKLENNVVVLQINPVAG
jgi:hypothetical protein